MSQSTRASVRRELLDYLGAAIAGRAAAGLPAWLKVLIDMGGRPDARVIGGPRVPATTAALCNGYYGHVLEFDDTHDEAVLHAGSAAIPAAFAAAGLRGEVSGKEFCEAVLLGIELTCRLGVATKLNLVEGGWIYTALFGHFGATLAAARLIDPRPRCCATRSASFTASRAAITSRRAKARRRSTCSPASPQRMRSRLR